MHASNLNKNGLIVWALFYCNGGKHPDTHFWTNGMTQARELLFTNLGIKYGKGHRIPHDLEGDFEYQGFRFHLFKSGRSLGRHKKFSSEIVTGRRAHRLYMYCPICPDHRLIPVGRLTQHMSVHDDLHPSNRQLVMFTDKPAVRVMLPGNQS